jgi:hypothetical protein
MSINRIGGPSPPTSAPAGASTARPATTGADFKTALRAQAPPTATSCSESLASLQAGQIDPSGYVALHVQQATAHLKMSPSALESLQGQLRDRCEADPLLRDLIEHATRARA